MNIINQARDILHHLRNVAEGSKAVPARTIRNAVLDLADAVVQGDAPPAIRNPVILAQSALIRGEFGVCCQYIQDLSDAIGLAPSIGTEILCVIVYDAMSLPEASSVSKTGLLSGSKVRAFESALERGVIFFWPKGTTFEDKAKEINKESESQTGIGAISEFFLDESKHVTLKVDRSAMLYRRNLAATEDFNFKTTLLLNSNATTRSQQEQAATQRGRCSQIRTEQPLREDFGDLQCFR